MSGLSKTEFLHSELVSRLKKQGSAIIDTLSSGEVDLWHGATGVVGEAGELIDAVKKHVVYNQQIDIANIIEELGDIEFYLEMIRQNLGITRKETLLHNMEKLNKRYTEGYTDLAAQERADKL